MKRSITRENVLCQGGHVNKSCELSRVTHNGGSGANASGGSSGGGAGAAGAVRVTFTCPTYALS